MLNCRRRIQRRVSVESCSFRCAKRVQTPRWTNHFLQHCKGSLAVVVPAAVAKGRFARSAAAQLFCAIASNSTERDELGQSDSCKFYAGCFLPQMQQCFLQVKASGTCPKRISFILYRYIFDTGYISLHSIHVDAEMDCTLS